MSRTTRRICSISSKCSWVADQRRGELDDRVAAVVGAAVEALVVERLGDEAVEQPLALLGVEGLLGGLVLDQLDPVEVAVAADVADDRQVEQPLEGGAERGLVGQDVLEDLLVLEDLAGCVSATAVETGWPPNV